MPMPRMRSLLIAPALVAALSTGCSGEPPPTSEPREVVPSTLAPRPTVTAPPQITIGRHEPEWQLNGHPESAGRQVWKQSMDLARDWTFRPELVMSHRAAPDELDGVTRLMTRAAAKRWRRDIADALRPVGLGEPMTSRRPEAALAVAQLALWNMELGPNRGWANPMFGPARVSNAKVIGGNGIGVVYTLRTTLRLRGHGLEYEIPYTSSSMLIWTRVDGAWKLNAWSRNATMGRERVTGPSGAVASSKAAEAADRDAQG